MGRLMGIDYGEKRVGIAVSDESGTLAFPYAVLANDRDLVPAVVQVIGKEQVEAIVIGESRDFSGADNPIMRKIRSFENELADVIKLPISREPEFLTSRQAEHIQGKAAATDASAAAIILQSFIDKSKNRPQP